MPTIQFDTTDLMPEQPPAQKVTPQHRLTIYIIPHCANCDYAQRVAASIHRDYPQVAVQVVDLANPSEPVPDSVFAAPTYLLDGRVWSLGNPSPAQIEAVFGNAVSRT